LAGLAADEPLLAALKTAPEAVVVEIVRGMLQRADSAERLMTELEAGRASPRLLTDRAASERLRALPGRVRERAERLTANLPSVDERLVALVERSRAAYRASEADSARGREQFRKICANCHRVGGEGAKIGPELDGIGLRGLDRLLEDVLDPSRNVDQAFRSTTIATTDGRALSGLLLRTEGQLLVLADAQGKEVRIATDEVAERSLSPLSPMPANVSELVPEAEFPHLLKYLLELRAGPAAASSPAP
jgi:putative heme-binding domain-containing protein